MRNKFNFNIILVGSLLLMTSCKKDWLDAKSNKALVIPAILKDFQALLDNNTIFNAHFPGLGELSSDDYFETFIKWQANSLATERNAYIWAQDIYAGETYNNAVNNWRFGYSQVFNANTVLDGLDKIEPDASSQSQWNSIRGSALFYRSFAFYNLAQLFSTPFDSLKPGTDLGIPLKLTSDINEKISRSTVKQTYDQIISDLKISLRLLPAAPQYKTQPSKASAYAMLAKTYLVLRDYKDAFLYADSSLQTYNYLIDYNSLTQGANNTFPISSLNQETIFYATFDFYYTFFQQANFNVDTTLYNMYNGNDLRKTTFFFTSAGSVQYRGSYTGSTTLFGGLAVDEIYLVRAECNARSGNLAAAMQDLNTLMAKRWKNTVVFQPYTASTMQQAISVILSERRKELLFRGIRWTDLRRLNHEGANIVLKRSLNGQSYTLPPNDPRYVLPIPAEEIQSSGIQQNIR